MTVTIATLGERALRRLGVTIVSVADRPALSATVPVATIATNALLWLAVIASDETPSPTDQALAVAKVSAIHDALVAQAVVSWPSTAIPNAVSEEMTMLAAQHLGPSFGKAIGDVNSAMQVEARIRKVALIMAAPALASDAVLSVHKDFVARGLARWSVFDLPPEVEDPYVYLAANQLAPLFGQKANPMDDAAANQSLFRYIALESSGETVRADYF